MRSETRSRPKALTWLLQARKHVAVVILIDVATKCQIVNRAPRIIPIGYWKKFVHPNLLKRWVLWVLGLVGQTQSAEVPMEYGSLYNTLLIEKGKAHSTMTGAPPSL